MEALFSGPESAQMDLIMSRMPEPSTSTMPDLSTSTSTNGASLLPPSNVPEPPFYTTFLGWNTNLIIILFKDNVRIQIRA